MRNDLISRSLLHKSLQREESIIIDGLPYIRYDAVLAKVSMAPSVKFVRCGECEKFWEYTETHKATVEKADGDCMIRCMVAPDDPQFCAVQKDDYCSMGKKMDAKDMDVPTKDGGA